MKIIAFSGRAAVGKTTIVRELMAHLYEDGYYPVYLPFAKALKEDADKAGFTKTEERESETVILIDDCRYINETKAIKDRGGKTVFVAGGDRTLVDENSAWRKHESEALANLIEKTLGYKRDALTPFCFTFWNTKSLEDLEENLLYAYEDWLEESPCDCELCKSRRENRTPDFAEVLKEIREILLSENIDPSEIFNADAHDSDS